jgi:hypothetical protein
VIGAPHRTFGRDPHLGLRELVAQDLDAGQHAEVARDAMTPGDPRTAGDRAVCLPAAVTGLG